MKGRTLALSDSESEDMPRSRRPTRVAKSRSKPVVENEDSASFHSVDDDESEVDQDSSRCSEDESSDGAGLFDSDEEEALSSKFKQPVLTRPLAKVEAGAGQVGKDIDWGEASSSESEDDGDEMELEVAVKEVNSRSNTSKSESNVHAEDDKEAVLENYCTIQLRRAFIERCVREPYFETSILNSFVRVYLGTQNGIAVYRMCVVTGVEQGGRKYWLADNTICTNKRLLVDIAGNQKKIKISDISNSKLLQG